MISGSHYDSLNFLGRDNRKRVPWRLIPVAYPTNSAEDRGQNRDLGTVAH